MTKKHILPEFEKLAPAEKKHVDLLIEQRDRIQKKAQHDEWRMKESMKESLARDLREKLDVSDRTQLYGKRTFVFPELYKHKSKK